MCVCGGDVLSEKAIRKKDQLRDSRITVPEREDTSCKHQGEEEA